MSPQEGSSRCLYNCYTAVNHTKLAWTDQSTDWNTFLRLSESGCKLITRKTLTFLFEQLVTKCFPKTWCTEWQACMYLYLYVCFVFERARAPRHFLLGKAYPREEIVNFYRSISRAPRQIPEGMNAIAFVASLKCRACAIIFQQHVYIFFFSGRVSTSKLFSTTNDHPKHHKIRWVPNKHGWITPTVHPIWCMIVSM